MPRGNLKRSAQSPVLQQPNKRQTLNGTYRTNNDSDRDVSITNSTNHNQRMSVLASEAHPSQNYNESEIESYIELCRTLYSENKITIKNAWQLDIMQVLDQVLTRNKSNCFQMAGSTLDVGVKVFGCRVDDVYDIGVHLANNLSSANRNEDTGEDHPSDAHEPNNPQAKTRRKKQRRMGKSNFIANDINELLCKPLSMIDDVSLMKDNVNESGVLNLINVKVPINSTSLLFNHRKHKYFETNTNSTTLNEDIEELDIPECENLFLAAAFKDFRLNQQDDKLSIEDIDEVERDDSGHPLVDLDGSIVDVFETGNGADCADNDNIVNIPLDEINVVSDVIARDDYYESDYSYLVKPRANGNCWISLSHWKIKLTQPKPVIYSGTENANVALRKPRKKKQTEELCLEKYEEHKMPRMRNRNLNWPEDTDDYLMPLSYQKIDQTCLRVKEFVSCSHRGRLLNSQNKADDDASNHGDCGNDDLPMHDATFEETHPAAGQFGQQHENLINNNSALDDVDDECEAVMFARQPKKIDMALLKKALWSAVMEDTVEIVTRSFKAVYKKLPQRIPERYRAELTIHLAINAFLHLCNEKGIRLSQKDTSDFYIESYNCL